MAKRQKKVIKPAKKAETSSWKVRAKRFARVLGIPLIIYFALFCLFTWPWISHFNGWFLTDHGDGLQNIWNMWWINESVGTLNQLPWHTNYLHAPYGVTLVGQTLNPFNGFVGIILLQFMDLTQAFNTMVVFSFLFGGLSMFWLCRYFTKAYIPSLIGGAIFTFSSYHFAHAVGHMQLVSLQFMPLFILLWWKLLKKPSYKLAIGASASLFLILLCDYYYFLYSLILAGFILFYLWWRKDIPSLKKRENWLPLLVFVLICLVVISPLPLALLLLNQREELLGSHSARIFSTDLLSPAINGGRWRFGWLTADYWQHIRGFFVETTVYMGLTVIGAIIVTIWKRAKIHRDIVFWLAISVFFGIMSLGPRLMVRGHTFEWIPMPYVLMERLVPGMELSGVPVRMMVMVTFGSAIIVAMVLAKINLKQRKWQIFLAAFCVLLFIEMWPKPLPSTPEIQPKYVHALKKLPGKGAVLDNAAKSQYAQLYHQTVFDKPVVLGYISRTPESLDKKEQKLIIDVGMERYDKLCSAYGLRYFTVPAKRPLNTEFPVVYKDREAIIYDLKNSPKC